jgi:hypothetical protein
MDAPLEPTPATPAAGEAWADEFRRSLATEQERVRDFFAARRQRWRQTELELVRRVEQLAAQLQEIGQRGLAPANQAGGQPAGSGDAADADGQSDPEGLLRRYEMALCDLRELKARHADLQKQLAEVEKDRAQPGRPAGGVLDWESEKRRILAALEASEGSQGAEAGPERLQIEEIVTQTQRLLAEKDRQIAELRKSAGESQAGTEEATARQSILDQDSVVCQEREELRQLQEEWRGKLRQAEVDLSVQRAKLARQEAEINEKLRRLGAAGEADAPSSPASQTAEKRPHGRWLSRLGLAGNDPPASER